MKIKTILFALFSILLWGFPSVSQTIVGYSGYFVFNTSGDFSANMTVVDINTPVQFTDLTTPNYNTTSRLWNFGDYSTGTNRTETNPVHVYRNPGIYTVSLTINNADGAQITHTKNHYIQVESAEKGIALKVVKTDPNSGPNIVRVGYYYTVRKQNFWGAWRNEDILVDYFNVVNGEAHLWFFPDHHHMPEGTQLVSQFNDRLILFDDVGNRRGSIHFQYNPREESGWKRDAIIILHNDSDILTDEKGTAFPYKSGTSEYDRRWSYYEEGEYPVSMLIPPNNTFPANQPKIPLLLIHGWEGKYSLKENPNAIAGANEISYWFTTAINLSKPESPFDTWQYYYPYNSAHHHLAVCLKSALSHLKQNYYPAEKIRLVTHSMGGPVTLRYLTEFPDIARQHVEKVLFSAPPAHGSLGANFYYKTTGSFFLQGVLGYDRHAPAVRDMQLGSDATWFLHSKKLPDLNNQNGVKDDYFVLLGTTFKYYASDTYFQIFNNLGFVGSNEPNVCVHEEAINHHDGIVSISSGSLLNQGVGFATFFGNHNDAVHMQSFRRNDRSNQNIGDPHFLPNIITQYFTKDYTSFESYLRSNQHITSVVDGNRQVVKPSTPTLGDLNTNDGVDYQKGILNLEFTKRPSYSTYFARYSANNKTLHLYPQLINLNLLFKGVFKRNEYSFNRSRYYFNDDKTMLIKNSSDKAALLYHGSAIDLAEGLNTVVLYNIWANPVASTDFVFRYCETNNVTINNSGTSEKNLLSQFNYTDTKENHVLQSGAPPEQGLVTSFSIDNQTSWLNFQVFSSDGVVQEEAVTMAMRLPDGSIVGEDFPESTFTYDPSLGLISMEIDNPMPGNWLIWLESDQPGIETYTYQSVAFLQSGVYAFLPDTSLVVASSALTKLIAGLEVEQIGLASNIEVNVSIINPRGEVVTFDISNSAETNESGYLFEKEHSFDLPGEYLIKFNIDGVYNNYMFERCLYQYVQVVDTLPVFSIPDVVLHQNETSRMLDLKQFIHNVEHSDTLYFSYEILSSTMDEAAYGVTMDSLSLRSLISANFHDAGTALVRYTCHFDQEEISTEVKMKILAADLAVKNLQLADINIGGESELILDFEVQNIGNLDAGEYVVSYFISQDTLPQPSDYSAGSMKIPFHVVDSIVSIRDTISIPTLDLSGLYNFIVIADFDEDVLEVNTSNNVKKAEVSINLPPEPPLIVSTEPGSEVVRLVWTKNFQQGILGYVIEYGPDSTGVLQSIHTLSTDTTYTVPGLTNGLTYYFSLSSYRIMGTNSNPSYFSWATPDGDLTFVPDDLLVNSQVISPGVEDCFNATKTITLSDFLVESGGHAELIAGENIIMLPGTRVASGGYLHAYITTEGVFCDGPEPLVKAFEAEVTTKVDLPQFVREGAFFKVYPNPTDGSFVLEVDSWEEEARLTIEVYSLLGKMVFRKELPSQQQHSLSLTGEQPGIYIIRVIQGNQVGVERLIKR